MQGKGAVHVVPDVTRIRVRVESVFPDYAKAYAKAKENFSWMVKILEYNNKPGRLAKTVSFDISDHTEDKYDAKDHYIGEVKAGFDLVQVIKVDINVDNVLVNKILKGVGKFIPDAQIEIGYTVQDPRPIQLKMLKRAVSDAEEKATIMADAAGCKLGKVQSIDYGNHGMSTYSQARNIHSSKEASASTPESLDIAPDDLVFSDTVDVVWQLVQ